MNKNSRILEPKMAAESATTETVEKSGNEESTVEVKVNGEAQVSWDF